MCVRVCVVVFSVCFCFVFVVLIFVFVFTYHVTYHEDCLGTCHETAKWKAIAEAMSIFLADGAPWNTFFGARCARCFKSPI